MEAAAGEIREGRTSHFALSFLEAIALGCRADGLLLGAAALGIPWMATSEGGRYALAKLARAGLSGMGPFPGTTVANALLVGLLGGPAILALHHMATSVRGASALDTFLHPLRHPLRSMLAGGALAGAWLGWDLLPTLLRNARSFDSDVAHSLAAHGTLLVVAAAFLAAGETFRSFREDEPRFRWLQDAGLGISVIAAAVFVPPTLFLFLFRLPIQPGERPWPAILDRCRLHPFDALLAAFAVLWFLRYLQGIRGAREDADAS